MICRMATLNFLLASGRGAVAALSRNASGKVLKFELRDLAARDG